MPGIEVGVAGSDGSSSFGDRWRWRRCSGELQRRRSGRGGPVKQDEGAGGFDLGRAVAERWLRVRAGAGALMEGAAKVFRCVGEGKKQNSERISLLGYL